MKKNKNKFFRISVIVEVILIIIATFTLQFFLFTANKKLEYANLILKTDTEQVNSLSFVEQDLIKEKLIKDEISSYPTGENAINNFIAKIQNLAVQSNCELYQVVVQSITPVAISGNTNEQGTTNTTTVDNNFSLASVNVQIRANYSGLIKFASLIRNMKEIVGISANNFEIPLDSKNSKENFISLPIFFIFKTN